MLIDIAEGVKEFLTPSNSTEELCFTVVTSDLDVDERLASLMERIEEMKRGNLFQDEEYDTADQADKREVTEYVTEIHVVVDYAMYQE